MIRKTSMQIVFALSCAAVLAVTGSARGQNGGTVYAWGYNLSGQLGNGSTANSSIPVPVIGLSGVTSIAGGSSTSYAITSTGTLYSWGDNTDGALGNGTTASSSTPVLVTGLSALTAVGGGIDDGLALTASGTVFAWGNNSAGQLGNGTTTNSLTPAPVTGLNGVIAIAAGNYHSLAVTATGSLYTWGNNASGQLGTGNTTNSSVPVLMTSLSNVTAVSGGYDHSLAIAYSGYVYAWGDNGSGELGNGTFTNSSTPVYTGISSAIAIAAGTNYSMALNASGNVFMWGDNSFGELGNGTTNTSTSPTQVTSLGNVIKIATNNYSSFALTANGVLWGWGYNGEGQLGDGTATSHYTPEQINPPPGYYFSSIASGSFHTLAITQPLSTGGSVFAWGFNAYGQLGNGSMTSSSKAVQTTGISGATAVAAGYVHSLALTYAGTVVAWGDNTYGELGNGTTTGSSAPVQVGSLSNIKALAAGYNFSLALSANGSVYAWGYNGFGQLGNGNQNNSSSPIQVSGLPTATAVAAGGNTSLALASYGNVYSWGNNASGQLGNGSLTPSFTPVLVSGIYSVKAISAGYSFGMALTTAGSVYTWGNNGYGQLGNGTTTQSTVPVQVTLPASVTAIAASTNGGAALASTGMVYAWGDNSAGELGPTAPAFSTTPVLIQGLSNVVSIVSSSTSYSYYALEANGSLWAWGYNLIGQLGDGTTTNRYVPEQIFAPTGYSFSGVAAGALHAVVLVQPQAVAAGGSVAAWGDNFYGELGNGTNTLSTTPVQTIGLSGIVAAAASGSHNVALNYLGTVYGWGYNADGELGNGSTTNSSIPVQTSGVSNVAAVAAGWTHSLALTAAGQVYAWGSNAYYQLGNSGANSSIPVVVNGIPIMTAVSGGAFQTLALSSGGTIYGWGSNAYGQLGNGTTSNTSLPGPVSLLSGISAIAAGGYHSLALTSAGTVWAFGYNGYGELGNGTTNNAVTPVQVSGLNGIIAIAAGDFHSLALTAAGAVYAWGNNFYGQLGNGTATSSTTPVPVSGLTNVIKIDASSLHASYALEANGTLWAWGDDVQGQLGDGGRSNRVVPFQVAAPVGFYFSGLATAGEAHAVALIEPLSTGGAVFGWGSNSNGQLGNGNNFGSTTAVQASGLNGVTSVAGGNAHNLAITYLGTVFAWGSNSFGQLGNGTTTDSNLPVAVTGLSNISALAAGNFHSLALTASGTVKAWGYNTNGQLGNGSTTSSSTPVAVSGLTSVAAIAAGAYHSMALTSGGQVKTWGYNAFGQLGNGQTTSSSTPVLVNGLIGVSAIAGGGYHSLALTSSGIVSSWGYNLYGQLGNGTNSNSSIVVSVTGISGIKAIAAGYYFSLALSATGTVYAWGYNGDGELGNGTTINSSVPVQVSGLSNVVKIAASNTGSTGYALEANGTLWSWGSNTQGQIGDGTTTNRLIPVQVDSLPSYYFSSISAGGSSFVAMSQPLNTWTGANSGNWSDPGNWSGGFVPAGGQIALFTQFSSNTTISLGGATQPIGIIRFDGPSCAAYTLGIAGSADTFLFDSGGAIVVTSTVTTSQILNAALQTQGPLTITNNGTGRLTFNGPLGGGVLPALITFAGSGTTTYAGVITTSGGGVLVQGPGTVFLTGANLYTGTTTITAGTLNINGDTALGAAANSVAILGGALQFASGGGVTLNSSRFITLGGGAIDTNGGNDTINGVLAGTDYVNSNLIKNGAGALTLTSNNTYVGSTLLNAGSLIVTSSGSLGSGALVVGNANSAAVPTQNVLYLFNAAQTVGPLSGTIAQPLNGNTAAIFLGTGSTLTVKQTAPGTFMGTIFGFGNLVVDSSSNSTLQLSNNNTYSGSTTINGGTVQLNVSNALPSTTALTFAATVGSGTAATLNLNDNNQQVASLSGGSTTSGFIRTGVSIGGILTIVNAGAPTTFGGVISGPGGLALGLNNTSGINNTQTLTLTGPNSFTGPVTINSGTLQAGANWVLNGGVFLPTQPPFGPLPTPYPGTFTLANVTSASLNLNNFNLAIGSLQGGGPAGGNISLGNGTGSAGSGGTLQVIQSQRTIYAGIISGNGNLIVGSSAGGQLILAGHNTYNGATYADLIQIAVSQALPVNNNVIFTNSPNDGLDLNGLSQTLGTISGGGPGNDNGKGTILDSQGTGSKLTIAFNPNNPLGGSVTNNFSGSIVNDVSVVVDAAIVGAAQTLTLSGTNNSTGSLAVGNATSSTSTGSHSGAGNSVVVSGSSSFGSLTIGNTYAGNIANNVTVSAGTGNLTVCGISIGDTAAGSTGVNTLTVGGTVTSTGDINIGSTSPNGVNTLTVLKGGTLAGSGNDVSIVVSNFSGGSGTLNANGNVGTAANPISTLLVRTGGLLAGGGTITTKGIGTAITINGGTIRGGVDGSNSYGTLTIAPAGGALAANSLMLSTNGQSGMGLATTLVGEVQRSGIDTVNASLMQLTGINKSLNIGTSAGGVLNINLNDPTASLLPGESYVINLVQTSSTGGTIRLNGRVQSANTVIDSGVGAGAGSGGAGLADLYITGNNTFAATVSGWALTVDASGHALQLAVTTAAPEPGHLLLMGSAVLLAGITARRRAAKQHLCQSKCQARGA